MTTFSPDADLAILMPKLGDYDRFSTRYAGLCEELAELSIGHFFAESHTSFDAATGTFSGVFDVTRQEFGERGSAPVVRDLTMATNDKSLYRSGLHVVHDPQVNRFLADKSNMHNAAPDIHPNAMVVNSQTLRDGLDAIPGERVVVKPVRGMVSKGVQVLSKAEAAQLQLPADDHLLMEFIDTSCGIPSLKVEGVHNIRSISIAGVVVGSIARVLGDGGEILRNDVYGPYVGNDALPASIHAIARKVHAVLGTLPGDNQNVIAIDTMRGLNAEGDQVDVLCEVNRRPMRISRYNLRDDANLDPAGIAALAGQWDRAEASMLAKMVG